MRRGWTGEADITVDHPAASYGKPVLLINGELVDSSRARLADYEIIDATPWELELLYRGGYHFDLEVT